MTLDDLKERAELLKQQQTQVQQMLHHVSGQIIENEMMQKMFIEEMA